MRGFTVYLGALLAMLCSWLAFVQLPQIHSRGEVPDTDEATGRTFPAARSGQAQRGLEIYRQLACHSCHTQQVAQEGYDFSVVADDWGTNTARAVALLGDPLPGTPHTLEEGLDLRQAGRSVSRWQEMGVEARRVVHPRGGDIGRWGPRRTVGRDFLFDATVMPGLVRIGPDLSNVGSRVPDPERLLLHLYQPRLFDPGSIMPSYPFLFEKEDPERAPLRKEGVLRHPGLSHGVIPTRAARDLAAYLSSLRVDQPLFEAPGLEPGTQTQEEGQ